MEMILQCWRRLLEGNVTLGVGSQTGATVGNRLVGKGELTEVMAKHLRLDFDVDEDLAVVDTGDGANHLGQDDHGAQMGLDGLGLLTVLKALLVLAQLLEEGGNLAQESLGAVGVVHAVELAADTARQQEQEFLTLHVKNFIEVDTSIHKLFEGASFGGCDVRHDCKMCF